MRDLLGTSRARLVTALTAFLSTATVSAGQDAPPPVEPSYPIVSIGALTFVQYVVDAQDPEHFNAFDLTRGYININADLNPRVSVRLTPDIRRAVGGPLDGSLVIRLKYGYVDFDGPSAGSWIRAGLQQTPWLDFEEAINRYRVEGQMFAEREGLIPGSADFGLGYFGVFGRQRLEVQAGVYNGEGFGRGEVDHGKSVQGRVTVRPFRGRLVGLRLTAFGDWGGSGIGPARRHAIGMVSYESPRAVLILQGLRSTRPVTGVAVDSTGVSGFVEIRRSLVGPAAFARVEQLRADDGGARRRAIAGVAYWLQWDRVRLGLVTSFLDARSTLAATQPRERQLAALIHIQF